jgi:hypothetical protein
VECADGSTVPTGQECPRTTTGLAYWLDLAEPFWLPLVAIVLIVAGVAATVYRARLIARTASLLGLSSSLDPAVGKFNASEMAFDGPAVGLRARLDMGETRNG